MADGSGPEGPRNKKGRPFGSGTTNAKRRELRKEKQWSALEGQDPSSPSCLMKHLEALEKAKEKCQAKLKEQLQEAIDGVGTSSSASSSNPPQKKQKSLEKDTASKEEKQRQAVLEKPGKKGFRRATLTPAEKVLEKTQQEEEEWVEVPEEAEEEVVVPKAKVLEKTKVRKMPKAKDLEKSSAKDLEKSSGRPLVVVDWHNTLEVNNDVPGRNAYALTMLLARADVLILSYVGTQKRCDEVLADIHGLPHWRSNKDGKLEAMVCWRKTGESGKTDIACARKAIAIFDDCKPILQEAIHWGVQPFAIQTQWQSHQWLQEPWASYSSFADAVDAFIQNNFFQ